jgi:ubiquinone/menaquinone biosynthesis C-methylase UbiE
MKEIVNRTQNADGEPPGLPPRGRCQGAWQILQFNWPFYFVGTAVCLAGTIILSLAPFPVWLTLAGWCGVGLGLFWLCASLIVSFYVYDASPLYRWHWLPQLFAQPPNSWVNIHAGLDETSLSLRALFPTERWQVLDIYRADEMTEPAIRRARACMPAPVVTVAADYSALPVDEGSADAVFLLFAAHEIRQDAARLAFFRELQRITAPHGKVIVVEHLRDTANFVAFGPGFWHFFPAREWRRLATESGFKLQKSFAMTPFVGVFVLEKPGG